MAGVGRARAGLRLAAAWFCIGGAGALVVRPLCAATELRGFVDFRAGAFSSGKCARSRIGSVEAMTIERLAGGAEMLVALAPDDGDEETAPTAGVSPFQSFTDNLFPQKQLLDASVLMRQQVEDGLRLVGILDVSSAELNKPTHSLSPDEGLYLTALAVHPAYRRRGVARALVDAAAARAAGIGRPALLLHVEKDNDGANRFYQAAGFDAPAVDKRYEQFAKSLDLSTERHVLYRLQLAARAAS